MRQADWTPEVFNLAMQAAEEPAQKLPEPKEARCEKTLELFPPTAPTK